MRASTLKTRFSHILSGSRPCLRRRRYGSDWMSCLQSAVNWPHVRHGACKISGFDPGGHRRKSTGQLRLIQAGRYRSLTKSMTATKHQSSPMLVPRATCSTTNCARANSTAKKAPRSLLVNAWNKLKALGLKGSCLIRLDSGNDAEENFAHFGQESFIIKRNLRRECSEQWLATARRVGDTQKRHTRRQERLHWFRRSSLSRRSEVLNVPCFSCL